LPLISAVSAISIHPKGFLSIIYSKPDKTKVNCFMVREKTLICANGRMVAQCQQLLLFPIFVG
jgi:hypothetical protein